MWWACAAAPTVYMSNIGTARIQPRDCCWRLALGGRLLGRSLLCRRLLGCRLLGGRLLRRCLFSGRFFGGCFVAARACPHAGLQLGQQVGDVFGLVEDRKSV